MDRRELLKLIAVLTGTAFIGGETLLSGCTAPNAKALSWSQDELVFMNEVGETILPATTTPGVKAANVSAVMKAVVNDCYDEMAQSVFATSINKINEASQQKFNKRFMEITSAQREGLLKEIDAEAKTHQKNKKQDEPSHFFTMVKQLTLLGYFTSEIGCTQARRYLPIPQRYEGCVPYHPGDKAIA